MSEETSRPHEPGPELTDDQLESVAGGMNKADLTEQLSYKSPGVVITMPESHIAKNQGKP